MKDSAAKKANAYLHKTGHELQSVFTKIRELNALNERFIAFLPAHLKDYCQVANRSGHKLVLLVANGSIATELHFQTADLLKACKKDPLLQNIQEIQLKVRPAFSPNQPRRSTLKQKKMPLLSASTAELIRETAESLTDTKLKAIMERIAEHVKKHDE